MKKREIIRLILMPIAFIAVVLFALLVPTGTRYTSADDILSVTLTQKDAQTTIIDTREGIQSFVDWLNLTVPTEEMCFVKETDTYLLDDADWIIVADQVPDAMEGIDNSDTFAYSIYHMYLYITDETLFYNGILYDLNPGAIQALEELRGDMGNS